jgi:Zn-dependent protease
VFDQLPTFQEFIIRLPGIMIGFTFHEFAHAWTAVRFGDDTPERDGRVTLNPMAHLDILGTLMFLTLGFGWAKPVMVNLERLRPRVLGDIVVSLAGVAMNFLLAVLFLTLTVLAERGLIFGIREPVLVLTLEMVYHLNLILIAFNLLPIPPLDGFHVVKYLFGRSMQHVVDALYRFGPFLLLLLLMIGLPQRLLGPMLIFLQSIVVRVVVLILSPILS